MDPAATLRLALSAYLMYDDNEVLQHLADYFRWRLMGGFEPTRIQNLNINGDHFALAMMNNLEDDISHMGDSYTSEAQFFARSTTRILYTDKG